MAEAATKAGPATHDKDQGKELHTENIIQQPGEVIAPDIPDGFVEKVVEEKYGLKVTKCKQLNGYDDKNYHIRVSPTSSNPHETSVSPDGYVIKVVNSMDTRRPSILYAQIEFMKHLRSHGIPTQIPVLSVEGENIVFYDFPSSNGEGEVKTHAVALRSFIPGTILYDVTLTHDLCFKVGVFLASMTKALEDFYYPFYDTFDCLWSMLSIPKLKDFVHVITDVEDRRVVDDVIEQFSTKVLTKREEIRKGYCHGDPNDQNILVQKRKPSGSDDEEGEYVIVGILDFQDATLTHPLFDLSLSIAYIMIMPSMAFADPLEVGGHILAGYTSRMELPEVERSLVRLCVAGRLVQSLVLGVYNHTLDPSNQYLLTTGQKGWRVLHALWAKPAAQVEEMWEEILGSYKTDKK